MGKGNSGGGHQCNLPADMHCTHCGGCHQTPQCTLTPPQRKR